MGRLTFHLRCKSIPITEKRVRLMSELVTAIKPWQVLELIK